MPWITEIKYEFINMRGETVKGEGEIRTQKQFPDLSLDWEGVYKHIERHSHDFVKELHEFSTVEERVGFKEEAKAKGWKMKDLAQRWEVGTRQMTNIAANPRRRDWDALDGLPEFNPDILVL